MQNALKAYSEFVTRHAWIVLFASLLASAVIASGMSRFTVDLDTEKWLPRDNRYVAIDRKIRQEFGGRNFVAIAVVPKEGSVWRSDILEVVNRLTLEILNMPGVIRQTVTSLSSPYVRIPTMRGETLAVEMLMKEVPQDADEIAALRRLYRSEPLFKGTVVSEDERAALILADFFDDRGRAEIARDIAARAAKYESPALRIAMTGAPVFEEDEREVMEGEGLYFLGTVGAILVILYLAFGQIQGVVIPTATALLSAAWAMGFMGYAGIPLNSFSGAVPLMVVTVAAGHSAQMLKRYYEEYGRLGDSRAAVVESTSRIGVVMLAAGGTAGCGFAALAILRLPVLAQFGLGVACGIFAAIILELTFMVALRTLWPGARETAGEGPLSRVLRLVLRPLEAAVLGARGWILASFTILAVAAIAGAPRLETDFKARDYHSYRSRVGQDFLVFEEHFPSTTTFTILLEGESGAMKSPEAIRLMRGLTRSMREDPGVGRTSSIADILERTYQVFAPEEAAGGLPEDANLISQLFFLASSPAFERYVDRAYSRSVVFGFLNREDSELSRRVINRVEAYLAEHPPGTIRVSVAGGAGPAILALNEHTMHGKILNIAIVLAVIFTIASLLLRTSLGGIYVVAPLVAALAVNLALFYGFGLAFDYVGASVAAIGVGIGADYAIYFLYRLREEYQAEGDIRLALRTTMETSGRAVLFVALAIAAGFSVNMLGDHRGIRMMGIFVPLTMVVSCLTALTLLPTLVILLRPRFIFDAAVEVTADAGESLAVGSENP